MGFETFGFGFGREDVWEPEEIFWGPEDTWLGDERYAGDRELAEPLGAVQMGLIYVNPEGPNGKPDPLAAARDIRETFGRMAMNDEETVALIAGGHTFGKTHGAGAGDLRRPGARGRPLEAQGLGWKSSYGTGKGADTITSGLEVTWTDTPTRWGNGFFEILFGHEWELDQEPGRRPPVGREGRRRHHPGRPRPDSPSGARRCSPPTSRCASTRSTRRSRAASWRTPTSSALAFAKAWYKLLHRDMGPVDALPRPLGRRGRSSGRTRSPRSTTSSSPTTTSPTLKAKVLESGLTVDQLVRTAWASAATYRHTDKRGGANGARIRLEPQRSWAVNEGSSVRCSTRSSRSSRSSTPPAARRSRWRT